MTAGGRGPPTSWDIPAADRLPPSGDLLLHLSTDRYQHHRAGHGVAVRTTAGAPRFRLGYELGGNLQQAAPDRAMLHLPPTEFADAYLGKLERVGLDVILEAAQQIADQARDNRLCLLCFCADRTTCHRRLLGDWLTTNGHPTHEHAATARTHP